MQFNVTSTPGDNTVTTRGQTSPPFKFPAAQRGDSADVILKYLETYARNHNVAIIAPGTQLSFLTIYQSGSVKVNTGSGTIDAPTSGFALNRIYIPNGDSDSENAKAINDQWRVAANVEQDADTAMLIDHNGDLIQFTHFADDTSGSVIKILVRLTEVTKLQNNCGMACILSRFVNGVWKRSPSRLPIGYEPATPYTFEDWLSTYKTTGAASKKYLNTGDESTGIQG